MDKKIIKNISILARIELTCEEEELYSRQLEDILGYFELLKEVNTDNIDLGKIGSGANLIQMRPDDENYLDNKFSREIIFSNLPEREGEFVKVKRVMNG